MNFRRSLLLLITMLLVTAGFLAPRWLQAADQPQPLTRSSQVDPDELGVLPPVTESIRFFEARLQARPEDVAGLTLLGQSYLRQGRERGDADSYARAQAAFERAVAAAPFNTAARLGLAQALFAQHDFAGTLALAQALYDEDPRRSQALVLIWDAQLALGQYAAAAETAGKVQELPASASLQARWAYDAELHGDLDRALTLTQQAGGELVDAAATRDDLFWYLTRLADLHFKRGEYGQAAGWYEMALQLQPDHYAALGGLARVTAAQGDYPAAIAWYQQAIERLPLPETIGALGDLFALTGQPELAAQQYATVEAIAHLAASQAAVAGQQLYNRQIALFLATHERQLETALQLAAGELALRQDVYGYDAYAWVLYRLGRLDEAQAALAKALALGTDDALLYAHAGLIYAGISNTPQAIFYLDKALTRNPEFDPLLAREVRETLAQLRPESDR